MGTFQDGGLWRNNPVDLALWEIQAVWPVDTDPDLVVSLGTGSSRKKTENSTNVGQRGVWKNGFISRLYKSFISSMDGQKFWQEFRNRKRVDAKGQYFRFSLEFDGPEPSLDNIHMMKDLKARVQSDLSQSTELDCLVQQVIASRFYFQLETIPQYEHGDYSCVGYIFCRLRSHSPGFDELLKRLSNRSARFYLDGRQLPGKVKDSSFVDRYGNFQKRVEFKVNDLYSNVSISLREGRSSYKYISGSPFSINSLMEAQSLNAPFGTVTHSKRKASPIDLCVVQKRRRI